jgi:hypothetical protein
MNRISTLLLLLLLLGKASIAQTIVTFKSLGFDDDAINGISGTSTYFLKVDPSVNIDKSKMVLFIEPSQVLIKNRSFINILIGDKPVYSTRLTNDSIQRISISLNNSFLSADRRYLKLQIKSLLNVNDDICKDLYNPALWIKLKGDSYLSEYKTNEYFLKNVNISNCFESKTAIVYPPNPTILDLKAVGWAYARLKRVHVGAIGVYEADKLPDTVLNYIMVGSWANLPADKKGSLKVSPEEGQGLIYLKKEIVQRTDSMVVETPIRFGAMFTKRPVSHQVAAETLFITGAGDEGYNNTITTLANNNIVNQSFGDYLVVNKADNSLAKTTDESRSRLTLKQLGGETNFLSGSGSLKSTYTFKNSDFSFTPKEVEIHIVGNYSSLGATDKGYFNIYLNGVLISTDKLDQTGKLNAVATVNRYELQKYNTLETEFRFYPVGGNCYNSFLNFFAEINVTKSYLQSKNPYVANSLSFYQYPEAFNTNKTTIILSRSTAQYSGATIGEIIYELNNNLRGDNFPDIVYSDKYDKGVLKKNNIVGILAKDDPIMNDFPDAPVHFNKKFRIYNNENNKTLYELSDTVSNGIAQIFYGKGNNGTLLITGTGNNLSDAFMAVSRSITNQLSTLSSNICIANTNAKYLFNINKDSDNLEYSDSKSPFAKFWESYNLYILLGILLLILISFLFVRSRVQRSQENFEN